MTVITSKGHAPVAVPAGHRDRHDYASAAAALTAAGFVPARANDYSPTVPDRPGHRHHADPPAGPQPYGSTVTVDVSLGPQPVTVPDVVGQVGRRGRRPPSQALGLGGRRPTGPPGSTTVLSTAPGGRAPRSAAGHHRRHLHRCEPVAGPDRVRAVRGGPDHRVVPRGRRVLGGRLRGVRRAHGGVEAARQRAARRRRRAHAGRAGPGGRRVARVPASGPSTGSCARSPTTSTPMPATRTGGSGGSAGG